MKMNEIRFVEENGCIRPIAEQKRSLRAYMKERRGQNENRDVKEILLLDNLKNFLFEQEKSGISLQKFFVYLSFSSEAPTDRLIEWLLKEGKEVYCPRIENKEMHAVKYGEDFTLSDYGIREPVGDIYEGELDVLIMPLLAIDKLGNRLGYGGGFYDKFIKKQPNAKRIAYCYDFQVVKNVPTEENDEKTQNIVTDKRIIVCEKVDV